MDYAYCYGRRTNLYLNATNRCSNDCRGCVRRSRRGLGDGQLGGGPEPDLDALLEAVRERGGAEAFEEIVWCGFGEPTYRLDLIIAAAPAFRAGGARVRLNTNGHACVIHGRDVLDELAEVVDAISISLNAPTRQRYVELCRPRVDLVAPGAAISPGDLFDATADLLHHACRRLDDVRASVVGSWLTDREIEETRVLAADLGCTSFRVR